MIKGWSIEIIADQGEYATPRYKEIELPVKANSRDEAFKVFVQHVEMTPASSIRLNYRGERFGDYDYGAATYHPHDWDDWKVRQKIREDNGET